jgi:multimeric flavodoxin WrbA
MSGKTLIISASNRMNSESKRVSELVLSALGKNLNLELIDLNNYDLPFFNDSNLNAFEEIHLKIQEADDYIIIVPEWGGMIPGKLKNLLLTLDQKHTGHKPALTISVSSGLGGANPISEIRSYGFKNNKIVFIPEYIIIRNVNRFSIETEFYSKIMYRIENSFKILKEYSFFLRKMRINNDKLLNKYPYGM